METMKKILLVASLVVLGLSPLASAQSSSGTLTVTATVVGSIQFTFEQNVAGFNLGAGAGTNAATVAFGNISFFGYTPPAGVTQTLNSPAAGDFKVSTPVDVKVEKSNSSSANYTLTAQLGSAPAAGISFTYGGSTLSSGSAATLTTTGSYGTQTARTLELIVASTFSAAAGGTSVNNTVNFVATAN
jgi:hypothetical protein